MKNIPTRIADLKVGDTVESNGGMFLIVENPFDSISHSRQKDTEGWSVGPAGVAVAKAVCIAGEVNGYFWPGSEWTFQGSTVVKVLVVAD
jgi:hypothetical protein